MRKKSPLCLLMNFLTRGSGAERRRVADKGNAVFTEHVICASAGLKKLARSGKERAIRNNYFLKQLLITKRGG